MSKNENDKKRLKPCQSKNKHHLTKANEERVRKQRYPKQEDHVPQKQTSLRSVKKRIREQQVNQDRHRKQTKNLTETTHSETESSATALGWSLGSLRWAGFPFLGRIVPGSLAWMGWGGACSAGTLLLLVALGVREPRCPQRRRVVAAPSLQPCSSDPSWTYAAKAKIALGQASSHLRSTLFLLHSLTYKTL